ncbi:MAG: crossover junction endodeoxyribonuclease RuvC, partial [Gammaproteobacteria bacterium]|nr:crossover junction endodeoxyribonuclease RuvC [Gammaproteobacteria bacterium]
HMVVAHLRLNKTPQADAADALAIALCHAQTYRTMSRYSSKSTLA